MKLFSATAVFSLSVIAVSLCYSEGVRRDYWHGIYDSGQDMEVEGTVASDRSVMPSGRESGWNAGIGSQTASNRASYNSRRQIGSRTGYYPESYFGGRTGFSHGIWLSSRSSSYPGIPVDSRSGTNSATSTGSNSGTNSEKSLEGGAGYNSGFKTHMSAGAEKPVSGYSVTGLPVGRNTGNKTTMGKTSNGSSIVQVTNSTSMGFDTSENGSGISVGSKTEGADADYPMNATLGTLQTNIGSNVKSIPSSDDAAVVDSETALAEIQK